MNQPNTPLGHVNHSDGEPVFDEAWQAQALGLADILVDQGVIEAAAWANTLGVELRKSTAAGKKDNADTYYHAVLNSLEFLLYEAGISRAEIADLKNTWRRAYLNTPHGMPVELSAGFLGLNKKTRKET